LVRERDFSILQNIQTSSEVHPASYSMGTRVLSLGVKQLRHEVNQSLPFTAEVQNDLSYTSTPPVYLHGVRRENLIFFIPASP
jgi:hypothetical protein